MSHQRERAELLAALHAAGASSKEDEEELQALLREDPSLQDVVTDFQDSIAALASSFEPLQTSPGTLKEIQKKIAHERGGPLTRFRRWLSRKRGQSPFSKD